MERAFLGVSAPGMFARAVAGPLVNIQYVRSDPIWSPRWSEPLVAPFALAAVFQLFDRVSPLVVAIPIGIFVAMLLSVAALLVPPRDVTQPPGRVFAVLEYALPGVSPRWRIAGGLVLLL